MDTPKKSLAADQPPSRMALVNAYGLILTAIWPRLSSAAQTTCRRVDHENTVDPKRTDITH